MTRDRRSDSPTGSPIDPRLHTPASSVNSLLTLLTCILHSVVAGPLDGQGEQSDDEVSTDGWEVLVNRLSLVGRSVVAVALLIGFYVLALGIAAGLLWTVYAQLFIAHRVIIKLAIICVVFAFLILWSVIPRPDRFEPPGPRLKEDDHPRLFALIREVAERTRQSMPKDVYLVADVNAFVAQRGGFMGIFSRRVMGIGLPLLSLLTVSELRAVIAHEFGHFHGGDTKVGPWIYKTRSAMARTIVSLAHSGSTIVRKPFEWYGTMFLKITHSISRAQELTADALAARVAGARNLVSGLKAVHGGAAAFDAFINHEYAPVIQAGYRPPLAQGFRSFLDGKQVKASLEKLLSKEMEDSEHDPFDTHPPLAQRIAAVEALDDGEVESDSTAAIGLLTDPHRIEAELIQSPDGKPLERLKWVNVTDRVLIPEWQKNREKVVRELGKLPLGELPRRAAKLGSLAVRLLEEDLSEVPDVAAAIGANYLASAVCATLAEAGWIVKNRIGRPIVLQNGEHRLSPFKDFASLANGKFEVTDVVQKLNRAGVADVLLSGTKSP